MIQSIKRLNSFAMGITGRPSASVIYSFSQSVFCAFRITIIMFHFCLLEDWFVVISRFLFGSLHLPWGVWKCKRPLIFQIMTHHLSPALFFFLTAPPSHLWQHGCKNFIFCDHSSIWILIKLTIGKLTT